MLRSPRSRWGRRHGAQCKQGAGASRCGQGGRLAGAGGVVSGRLSAAVTHRLAAFCRRGNPRGQVCVGLGWDHAVGLAGQPLRWGGHWGARQRETEEEKLLGR